MSIIRAPRPDNNFYMLDKRISEDKRLGWAARGLLIYLLGKPDNWRVSVPALIAETNGAGFKTGRDGVYRILKELAGAGYVRHLREAPTDTSPAKCEWEVCERFAQPTRAENPDGGHADNPHGGRAENPDDLLRTESSPRTERKRTPVIPTGNQALPGLEPPPNLLGKAKPAPAKANDTAQLIEAWNAIVGAKRIPKVAMLTEARKATLLTRYEELGGTVDDWIKFCRRIAGSPFLTGDNDRDWMPNFDWCLKPANFVKIIEGTYDSRNPSAQPGPGRFIPSPGTI